MRYGTGGKLKPTETKVEVLQTYTLRLIGPPEGLGIVSNESLAQALLGGAMGPLREAEENLTDLLPEGYSVRIMEWDAKEDE